MESHTTVSLSRLFWLAEKRRVGQNAAFIEPFMQPVRDRIAAEKFGFALPSDRMGTPRPMGDFGSMDWKGETTPFIAPARDAAAREATAPEGEPIFTMYHEFDDCGLDVFSHPRVRNWRRQKKSRTPAVSKYNRPGRRRRRPREQPRT